jgi:hypothetical protein
MSDDTTNSSKLRPGRVNASSAAIAQKIKRLPPGEHLVELRAKALPDQMVLRIAVYSAELEAGTALDLDKIFRPEPTSTDVRGMRAYTSQGALWLGMVAACGLQNDELQDITLEELAGKISGKQVVAIINDSGYWSRVRSL